MTDPTQTVFPDGKIPLLKIALPRPVRYLHQVELTSHCNLRCVYCPSPKLARPKVHMSEEVFVQALAWLKFAVTFHGQDEINLAGIGESTLHPRFLEYAHRVRDAVGNGPRILLATNGLIATEEIAASLRRSGVHVFVSMHRPEKAGLAIELYGRHGILANVSAHPSLEPNDWAGQVKWMRPKQFHACPWMRQGWVMLMADGRATRCCLDASGIGELGSVLDASFNFSTLTMDPYPLCKTCYQAMNIEGYDQFGSSK